MSPRRKAFGALLLVSVLWGTAGVVAKTLLQGANPFVITFWRFGLAALVLLPFFLKEKKRSKWWKDLIPLSALNSGNTILFYLAMTKTTVTATAVLGSSTPLIVALLSSVLIGERLTVQKVVGIIVGLAGALFIILLPALFSGNAHIGDFIGNTLFMGAVLCFTFYTIWSKKFLTDGAYSPLSITFTNFAVTSTLAYLAALSSRKSMIVPALLSLPYLSVFLYTVFGVTITTFFLYQWAMQHVNASTAILKDYIQLVVGVWLAILILGEKLTGPIIIGTILVLAGVVIATQSSIRKRLRATS